MSGIRQQNNPLILKLLREHDALDADQWEERKALQRRILFLMTTIKLHELEIARERLPHASWGLRSDSACTLSHATL